MPMRGLARANAFCAFMAALGCSVLAWLGLYGLDWNDYEVEARPAFEALSRGHLSEFLHLAPVYGGSLIERAPFVLAAGLWNGGQLSVYRMAALPCLLASAVLGVWLVAGMRSEGRPMLTRAVVLALCVANPITVSALEIGHPEELLGGCMCVGAVLLAGDEQISRHRGLAIGVLLGLAVANKEWALLALPPTLLALPQGRRLMPLAASALTSALVLGPLLLSSSSGFAVGTQAVAQPGATIFQPWQLWWFTGRHGALVHGAFGDPKPGYRIGPSWAGAISHPLILVTGLLLGVALWLRSRGVRLKQEQALQALALVLLLRCLLDTWDVVYYPLPFILALLAWETRRAGGRPPVLALSASTLTWLSFRWLPAHVSADWQAAAFLAWSLPLTMWLGFSLFAGVSRPARPRADVDSQPITVRFLGKPVRTSAPSSLTTARSSIRTPSTSGR
jgi:hypothetical protein